MYIKHSKFKNTGVLFEILTKRITADTLQGESSAALKLLKKYFLNTELGKEYKLYEIVTTNKNLTESKANTILTTVLETSKKLNRTTLRKQKYNLIKELKEYYNIEEIFQTKINEYKAYASLYTLFEIYNSEDIPNAKQIIENKTTLLEHLSSSKIDKPEVKDDLLEEFKGYDKDLRILTYHILLENFNKKYVNLSTPQKRILKEFIVSVDNSTKLKEFYNDEVLQIKSSLKEFITKSKDEVLKVKLNEVKNLIPELNKRQRVNSNNLIDLLQYHSLLEEIKKLNG